MSTGALTCGGYGFLQDNSKSYLADSADRIDCWWFTPGNPPRWDNLKVSALSAGGPAPRFGHSMSFDSDYSSMVIFGGQGRQGVLLNDCWTLTSATNRTTSANTYEYMDEYQWASCDPASTDSLKPQARYGHQSVSFYKSLYVVGGFAQDGLRIAAKQDIWILELGGNESWWLELMPTTTTPEPRGFHAMWLSGFKIFLHGGQGPSGSGTAAVLGDTWQFDLFTKGGNSHMSASHESYYMNGR